jgi:hypothetical protein
MKYPFLATLRPRAWSGQLCTPIENVIIDFDSDAAVTSNRKLKATRG